MKVLIIEDEPLIRKSLKMIIESKGVEVDTAGTGHQAIQMIEENHYDKIICDLMLKDTTGFDIIESSKNTLESFEIPKKFIIITAYLSDQVLEKAKNYGCKVISKPFEDMEMVITQFLE